MKFKWTSSHIFIIKFLLSLFVVGLVIGIYTYYNQPDLVRDSINNELEVISEVITATRPNNFIRHIIIFSVMMLASLTVIGLPLIIFYFFYEAVSAGFLLASFFNLNGMQGLFFGLIFNVINKIFIYLALMYLILFSINYVKRVIVSIKNKDSKIYEYITHQIIKNIFIIFSILVSDLIIFFLANIIIGYFLFLL